MTGKELTKKAIGLSTQPLHLTTKQLRQLKNCLFLADVTAYIVKWDVVPPQREDGWTMIAWAVDVHKTHRYLFVKDAVAPDGENKSV